MKGVRIDRSTSLEDLAGLVCATLEKHGISAILTGGAVVSIYSENEYQSYDLDFVTRATPKQIDAAMKELGFSKEKGRHYIHPETDFFVEFPGYTPTIGNEPMSEWARMKTRGGVLSLLDPTQCVMDRLAAYFHWNDKQGLDQAVMVAHRHPVKIETVRKWARNEGALERFKDFENRLKEK